MTTLQIFLRGSYLNRTKWRQKLSPDSTLYFSLFLLIFYCRNSIQTRYRREKMICIFNVFI